MRGHHHCGDFATEPYSRVACCHVPISHIFGLNHSTGCHLAGLKVVHPSATFHPTSTWDAIRLERCSEIPGVPALILALIAHPACKTTDRSCLKHVHMGSTTILPETIRVCIEELGCGRASEAYGMTETGPAILHSFRDLPLQAPEIVTAGRIHPEAKIRICKPGSREVVERGVAGECHVGGDVVVTEYWRGDGKRDSEGFYTDEGTWIVTGDQAIMDPNGELRVVGRYKDLIIRGGENISPSAIESIVFSRFGLVAEVIGIPDDIAGEIPVAVVKSKEGVDLKKVREIL
jgi:acyl-CoA synthetase (AMP-forming)/AMP-acid ligase II